MSRHARLMLGGGLVGGLLLLSGAPASAAGPAGGDSGVRDASGGSASAQTEQTIAVDPTDSRNVLVGYIGGLSLSHDGGLTWRQASVTCAGDNNPQFDRAGVAYYECDDSGVTVYASPDKGATWGPPRKAATLGEGNADLADRPWLVRGAGPHSLVVGWESFFTNPVGSVYLTTSNDGGATWSPGHRVDDAQDHAAQPDPRQFPAVGADGTIYDAYASGQAPFLDCRNCGALLTDYVVARSTDGGVTFTRVVAAANVARTNAPTEESEAISSLAADPDPSRAGHLALAWSDERSGESRIVVSTSVDGGRTWSALQDVADDPPGTGNNHDHVQVAFAADGRLVVVWRDRRCCGTGWSVPYELFVRTLDLAPTGVLVPGAVQRVTDAPQAPNASSSVDEYLGLAVGPEGAAVAWNQPRAGNASSTYRRLTLDAAPAPVVPEAPLAVALPAAATALIAAGWALRRRPRAPDARPAGAVG